MKKILLLILGILFFINLILAVSVGTSGMTKGKVVYTPPPFINYSIVNTNSSDFWDNYDTESDLPHLSDTSNPHNVTLQQAYDFGNIINKDTGDGSFILNNVGMMQPTILLKIQEGGSDKLLIQSSGQIGGGAGHWSILEEGQATFESVTIEGKQFNSSTGTFSISGTTGASQFASQQFNVSSLGNLDMSGNLTADNLFTNINWSYILNAPTTSWLSTQNDTYDAKADYQFLNNNFNGSGGFTTSGLISGGSFSNLDDGTIAGQMAFWDGSKWVKTETTELFWDDTNKRLGIGTSTPERILHLYDGDGAMIIIDGRKDGGDGRGFFRIVAHERASSQVLGSFQFLREEDSVAQLTATMDGTTEACRFAFVTQLTTAEGMRERMSIKGNGNVGVNTSTSSYPFEVSADVSGISIYASKNISAKGYITRTSIFDKTKNVWDYVKDASHYLTDNKIDHKKFYGYAGEFEITNYLISEVEQYIDEECEEIIIGFHNQTSEECNIINDKIVCENVTRLVNDYEVDCIKVIREKTVYPYKITEEGVSLDAEVNVLRQAVYELNERVKYLEDLKNPTPI